MRAISLPLVALALAGLADAAPAPLPRRERGPQPPVELNGRTPVRFTGTFAITTRSDWETFTRSLEIGCPKVDFRTNFLFVHGTYGDDPIRWEIDGAGDLHVIRQPAKRGMKILLLEEPADVRYFIKSFPRSAVRTVNGQPLHSR